MTRTVAGRPPPNVLVLMCDEHRFDVASFAGDPVVRTPTLERIARQGVVFDNAYTPSPICIPARQALAAGRWPHAMGVEDFSQDLAPGAMTFARWFAQHGYYTVACGKLHHTGPDQMQGWRRRIGAEMEVATHFVDDRDEAGFTRYTEPSSLKWPLVTELQRAGLGPSPLAIDDEYAVQGALNFLNRFYVDPLYGRATPETPLMLMVSLNEPHYPYATERKDLFEHYWPRVEVRHDAVSSHSFLGGRFKGRPGIEVTEVQARNAVAVYYAMVESADARLGRVVHELERLGQNLSNWIIVYTSDHGEMLGEHGVWEKQKFFEGSARVPLIIKAAGNEAPRRRVCQNVSLVDVFATLTGLAGLTTPDGLDSRSLVPLMHGESGTWNDEVLSEFAGKNLMIKQAELKYQYYAADGSEVLFDLATDPAEVRNALARPRLAESVERLRRRRDELGWTTR